MIDVLVVGGVYREHLSHPKPCSRIGGSGLYAAAAAATFGASTALAASVGADDGEELSAILNTRGVDDSAVELRPGQSAAFVIDNEGEVQAPEVQFKNGTSAPGFSHDPPPARVVLVFGMPDLDPFALGLVARWVGAHSTLLWDRQGWLSKTPDATAACGVAARSKVYLANIGEASQEAGGASVEQLVRNHPLPGFDWALLKNGRWGTTLLGPGTQTAIPAFRVPVVSTIGSGDVFAGALAAGLAAGDDIQRASVTAAAAASVSISAASPLIGLTSRREIEGVVSAGKDRYVDPTQLSLVSIAVESAAGAAAEPAADQLKARLQDLALGIAGPATQPTVRVVLRVDGGHLVAEVSDRTGASQTIKVGRPPNLGALVDAIADRVERHSAVK